MFTSSQAQLIEKDLQRCKNVQEMFNVLESKFHLDKTTPGDIAKPLFIKGIIKGIKLIDPPLKK